MTGFKKLLARSALWAPSLRASMVTIFAVSCTVRCAVLAGYLLTGHALYTAEAENIARSLLANGVYGNPFAIPTGPTAHCPPVYPCITAGVYAVFGTGMRGQVASCVLSILIFSVLYSFFPLIAVRFGLDARAGWFAGLVRGLLPVSRSAETIGGWEAPYAALLLALLLIWTRKLWREHPVPVRSTLLWGVAWGGAGLLHTSLLAVFATLCGALLFLRRDWKAAGRAVVAVLGCALALLPWTIRNRVVLGAWIVVRSNAGIEFELGNHEGSGADVEQNMSSGLHPSQSVPRAQELRDLGEIEYNRRAMRRTFAWIAAHPRVFLRLTLERFLHFWFSSPLHPLEFSLTFAMMAAGMWGMVRLAGTKPDLAVLWTLAFISFSVIYCITQYSARYRVVVEWIPLLAAGQLAAGRFLPKRRDAIDEGRLAAAKP